jgi:methionine-gamma-lyase
MSCPSVSTSSEIPEKEQREMNLSPGLLRLSIGFTGDLETQWRRFQSGYDRLLKETR